MKAQHWLTTSIPGDCGIYADLPDGRRVCIATVHGWPGITDAEFESNRRLLRTAPELMAALQRIIHPMSGDDDVKAA